MALGIFAKFRPGAFEPFSTFPQFQFVNKRPVLSFDASTDESCYWTDVLQAAPTGTVTCDVYFMMASATTGSVRFECAVEAFTPGDSVDLDAGNSFDTGHSGGTTVPGTAGYMKKATITLTNLDSWAVGDLYRIAVNRDADGSTGTDDATGDCHVLMVTLVDT